MTLEAQNRQSDRERLRQVPASDRRRELMNTVNADHPSEAVIASLPLGGQKAEEYYGNGALSRIERTRKETEGKLNGQAGKPGLLKQVQDAQLADGIKDEVLAMLDTLIEPGPDELGGRRNPRAQHLKVKDEVTIIMDTDGKKKRVDGFTITPSWFRENQKKLDEYGEVYPQYKPLFASIKKVLEDHARSVDSFELAIYDYNEERSNTPLNKETAKLGKLAIVMVTGAMAIITGLMSIFSKKFSAAPFIYAGIALYLAMGKDFFKGKVGRDIGKTVAVVKAPQFKKLAQSLGKDTLMKFMRNAQELRFDKDRGRLLAGAKQKNLSDADRGALLDLLAPKATDKEGKNGFSPQERSTIEAMLGDGTFAGFLDDIQNAKGPEVQRMIEDYIREGSYRYDLPSNPLPPASPVPAAPPGRVVV